MLSLFPRFLYRCLSSTLIESIVQCVHLMHERIILLNLTQTHEKLYMKNEKSNRLKGSRTTDCYSLGYRGGYSWHLDKKLNNNQKSIFFTMISDVWMKGH